MSSVDGLGDGAREAVEEHPVRASGWLSRASIIRTTRSSGTSPPGVHDRLGLAAEGGVARHLAAQHVAGCNVRNAEAQATRAAWVPLPLPGGPNMSAII